MSIDFQASYDRQQFVSFLQNDFLPDDYSFQTESIDLEHQTQHIEQVTHLGKTDSLDCHVYEIRHHSEYDPRVTLTKETFKILASYGVSRAMVSFVSTGSENYRFSLVTIEFKRSQDSITREYSNPKRYSFFLGPDAKIHTPQEYLIQRGRVRDFEVLQNRFSVEGVNKDFYNQIAILFTELVGGKRRIGSRAIDEQGLLRLPGLPNAPANHQKYQEFAVRLIGRLVFCWFLKKKHSPNRIPLIPDSILSSLGVDHYYYHNTLENLFFQILNTPVENRLGYLQKERWCNIPFLNGGLFEPHEDDYYKPDAMGVSSYLNTLKIPDDWFHKLFEVFETYNFTIDENTAIDIELSIDPEMLGRIFENLLAEINPETGETARKHTGSYYTPRPIVEYMVDQSLKQYLKTKAGLDEPKADQLLDYSQEGDLLTEGDMHGVIDALHEIKIIDPACGSGAFPMGILQKMVLILQKVDPDSKVWAAKQLAVIPNAMLRRELEKKLSKESRDYVHKLGIIQHSIYGVDIQPIAVEIAKLRFFLSLIVDEEIDDSQENRGLRHLPNLEFKFVCADTLVKLSEEADVEPDQSEIFADEFFNNFSRLVESYFSASEPNEKISLKNEIEILINKKVDEKFDLLQSLYRETAYKKVKNKRQILISAQTHLMEVWESYKNLFKDKAVKFFETKYFFPEVKDGFDVVIANPPYVRQEQIKRYKPIFQEQFHCYTGTSDLYVYFYERAFELLGENGILTFISSNKYFRSGYGKKLRDFLGKNARIMQIIDFGDAPVFTAISYPSIIVLLKSEPDKNAVQALNWETGQKLDRFSTIFQDKHFLVKQQHLTSDGWRLESPEVLRLLDKLRNAGTPLGEYVKGRFYYGIKTGLNEAFVVDGATKELLISEHPSSKEVLKPFLRGRDVKRWQVNFQDQWLIKIESSENKNHPWSDKSNGAAEKVFSKTYPAIHRRFQIFREKLIKRDDQGKYFWELRSCKYWEEFEKSKIIFSRFMEKPLYTFDEKGYYHNNAVWLVPEDDKYLCSVLNSQLGWWYLKHQSTDLQNQYLQIFRENLFSLSIPEINSSNRMTLTNLADQLLDGTLSEEEKKVLENELDEIIYTLYDMGNKEKAILKL